MVKKKSKRKPLRLQVALIAAICTLNLLGFTYANWNDGLTISASFITGDIDPVFSGFFLEDESGTGKLDVKVLGDKTVYIDGEVETDYNASIKYWISNKGTIPIEYSGQNGIISSALKDGLELLVDESPKVHLPLNNTFYKSVYKEDNHRLHLNAKDEGQYSFELKLPYKQWVK